MVEPDMLVIEGNSERTLTASSPVYSIKQFLIVSPYLVACKCKPSRIVDIKRAWVAPLGVAPRFIWTLLITVPPPAPSNIPHPADVYIVRLVSDVSMLLYCWMAHTNPGCEITT